MTGGGVPLGGVAAGVATGVAITGMGVGTTGGSSVRSGVADSGAVGTGVRLGLGAAFSTASPPGVPATMLGSAGATESG